MSLTLETGAGRGSWSHPPPPPRSSFRREAGGDWPAESRSGGEDMREREEAEEKEASRAPGLVGRVMPGQLNAVAAGKAGGFL